MIEDLYLSELMRGADSAKLLHFCLLNHYNPLGGIFSFWNTEQVLKLSTKEKQKKQENRRVEDTCSEINDKGLVSQIYKDHLNSIMKWQKQQDK